YLREAGGMVRELPRREAQGDCGQAQGVDGNGSQAQDQETPHDGLYSGQTVQTGHGRESLRTSLASDLTGRKRRPRTTLHLRCGDHTKRHASCGAVIIARGMPLAVRCRWNVNMAHRIYVCKGGAASMITRCVSLRHASPIR